VNVNEVTPVAIKSPTLIADHDPYDSIKATAIPDPTPQPPARTVENEDSENRPGTNALNSPANTASVNAPSSKTAQSAPEIRKAVPVEPIRKAIPVQPQEQRPAEIRRAIPVKPLDQEETQHTLLRSAAQPPGDTDD
jgi:hypothetical protein